MAIRCGVVAWGGSVRHVGIVAPRSPAFGNRASFAGATTGGTYAGLESVGRANGASRRSGVVSELARVAGFTSSVTVGDVQVLARLADVASRRPRVGEAPRTTRVADHGTNVIRKGA